MRDANGTDRFCIGRRDALVLGAGGLLSAFGTCAGSAAEPAAVPTDQEPHHHVIFQNGVMRVMRVMIPPGEATGWHEHKLDFVVTVLAGTPVRTETPGEGAKDGAMVTASVTYNGYQAKPTIHRVTNTGRTLNHQLTFELLRPQAGHFGKADRSAAKAFELALDEPRVRAWRLKLDPGLSTDAVSQNGPGLRVVLAGTRLIETVPGQAGHEALLQPGDATFLPPMSRIITNAAESPLDLIEFELR